MVRWSAGLLLINVAHTGRACDAMDQLEISSSAETWRLEAQWPEKRQVSSLDGCAGGVAPADSEHSGWCAGTTNATGTQIGGRRKLWCTDTVQEMGRERMSRSQHAGRTLTKRIQAHDYKHLIGLPLRAQAQAGVRW
jgi:hypothetical protein